MESPLLLTAWASVYPSVNGACSWDTFWEGLEEALGLPEGSCLGTSSILLGFSRDVSAPRLILEETSPP